MKMTESEYISQEHDAVAISVFRKQPVDNYLKKAYSQMTNNNTQWTTLMKLFEKHIFNN